jgi:lysophospholipase L1-like esterase
LLVAGVITVASACLGEVAFRAAKRELHRRAFGRWEHELYERRPDADFVYSLRPGVADGVVKDTDIHWRCSVNSTGQRGPELLPVDAGRRRVVVLGDSYTFGWAVADDETLPAALGRSLAAEDMAPEIEVVNAGVPGFNTWQQAAFLAEQWPVLRPDVVVLAFVMNDAEPPRVAPCPPNAMYLCARSWLLEEAKYQLNRVLERPLFEPRILTQRSYLAQFADGAPERGVCRAAFGAIVSRCRGAGVPLLVAVLPDTTCPVGQGYPYRAIHDTVSAWCAEHDVECVDLVDTIAELAEPDRIVRGDGHPSPAAYTAFADALAPALSALLGR